MAYKSNDKDSIESFRTYLKTHVTPEDGKYIWDFYNKHLFIDDLNTYYRAKTGKIPIVGYGNYNSSVAIALPGIDDKKYTDFFKSLSIKLKMDFNNFYFTPYHKSVGTDVGILNEVLLKELQKIKPKVIYTIGKIDILDIIAEAKIVDKENFDKMLELSNKENLSENEVAELTTRKSDLWSQIKNIIMYYEP